MYVVFGAYLAYSIADRTGLVVGFFGGLLSTLSGAGFFRSGYYRLRRWLSDELD